MVTMPPDRIPATATEEGYIAAIAAMERVGKPPAAIVAYENFLRRWPDNLAAHVGLANAHYALGELKAAEEVLRRAAGRHPDSVVVLNNLAQTLSDQKRNDEALTFIERALAIGGPFAATVRETREAILQRMGQKN
jgi:tetratricopeptide (TPR) repeat protein